MSEGIKVILVDDEAFVLELIRKAIDWEGIGVELIGCCTNAMAALDCMIDETPDILITDIKMPVMNGLELIKKMKQMNPQVECIVLSGYAEFDFAKTAMEQGVKHYLLKPFSKTEFEGVLKTCKDQILSRRQGQVMDLQKRNELVEKLVWKLQLLKEKNDTVNIEMIRNVMSEYSDLSLLSSAMISLAANFCGNDRSLLECITKLFDKERDIYEVAVYAMNELFGESTKDALMIRKIKEYTREHYNEENLNLQLIADHVVHWGVKYTGRRFLKETGIKYSEYLQGIRMEKAKELLKTEDECTIEYVAEKIGLGYNVSYFYQLFKRYTGMTPKEYRAGS